MYFYLTAIISLILDIISKKVASSILSKEIQIFGDYIKLKLVNNKGMAFSLPLEGYLLKIITLIIISGIIYYYFKIEKHKNEKIIDIGYGLIIGGAIGNGIERIINGQVIDFISVKYFAIFNFGDIFINIGALILIIYYYTKIGQPKNKK